MGDLTRNAICSIVGHTSCQHRVGMVKRSKWCSSSMCSRLTGTPSDNAGATEGDQSISPRGGMDVGDGESLSLVRLRDSGGVRTQRSHLLTQLPHGSPSSHCFRLGSYQRWCSSWLPSRVVGRAETPAIYTWRGVCGGVTDLDLAPLAAYTPKP